MNFLSSVRHSNLTFPSGFDPVRANVAFRFLGLRVEDVISVLGVAREPHADEPVGRRRDHALRAGGAVAVGPPLEHRPSDG